MTEREFSEKILIGYARWSPLPRNPEQNRIFTMKIMKTPLLLVLIAAAALASAGCSASARVSVDRNSATTRPGDTQVAFISKTAPASDRK